ncbi:MAG TPA: hypothetical protein VGF06_15375 [Terriglobales bacterium]
MSRKWPIILGLLMATAAALSGKDSGGQLVDSGSFGVFLNGRRVMTETFSIHQQEGGVSTIASQVKEDSGPSSQNSELQVTASGALVRYEWHEDAPDKSSLVVVPNNEFLVETVTQKAGEKPVEQPFLLPNTSPVVDNNFFVHRQVLAWRYLASSCTTEAGKGMKCGPADFGTLVPQERLSAHISVQPVGDEKVAIRGVEQQLLRIDLKGDDGQWQLWLNPQDHYKLMRVTKTDAPVEVVRD